MILLRVGCIITKSDRCAEKMTNAMRWGVKAKAKAKQLASAAEGSAEAATVGTKQAGATGSAAARPRLGSGPPRGRHARQPAAPDASGEVTTARLLFLHGLLLCFCGVACGQDSRSFRALVSWSWYLSLVPRARGKYGRIPISCSCSSQWTFVRVGVQVLILSPVYG